MKKLLFIFVIGLFISPVFAADTGVKKLSEFQGDASEMLTSKNYVDAGLNTKQEVLGSENVSTTGSGNIVTSVTASDGTVTVQRSNVTIPVGGANASNYATIWLE